MKKEKDMVDVYIAGSTDSTDNELHYTFSETEYNHSKHRISLRYFLSGKGWHSSLKALNFAEQFHTGTRKDGKTPEFNHQVSIAQYVITLPELLFPEETITTVFLHDVPEDYDIGHDEIETKFGKQVSIATELVTKFHRGEKKHPNEYFREIAKNPIASIVKGADRIHNLQSMVGTFSFEKQERYMEEVKTHFLPMLKTARRLFPEQELAYENIKHMLISQMQLIEAIHYHHQHGA